MVDKTIDEQPLLIAPVGADVPAAKTNTDYRIRVGEANGLAVLDVSAKLPISSLPAHTHTTADVTGLQTALDGKQPLDADLTSIAGLAGTTGLLKKTAANTWTLDTSAYLTGNQTITLSGDATGSGTTSIVVTVVDDSHNHVISNVDNLQTTLDGKQPLDADLTAIAGLAGTTGLLRKTAANTWSLDTASYLTANQTITLTGDVSGSGTTSIAVTVADDSHNHIIANVDGLQTALDAKLDDSQATATGLAVLGAANQDAARDAIGVYVQATDPGAVADGSIWIWMCVPLCIGLVGLIA